MIAQPPFPDHFGRSVLAVPPLARHADLSLHEEANRTLIHHLEAGGVTALLYGGNANLYNISTHGYAALLDFLSEAAGAETLVIPSIGPAYGTMMEQARLLRDHAFPTVMALPPHFASTPTGVETGIRRVAEALGRPILLYVKREGMIAVDAIQRLVADGLLSGIKYAIVREDSLEDAYLRRLVETIDRRYLISGMGEQPATIHLHAFHLNTFTSGCVCIAPRLSTDLLRAAQAGDFDTAERLRETFAPLERLRDAFSPIRVLHEAVTLAGLADMGPMLPHLTNLEPNHHDAVREAARTLLAAEEAARRQHPILSEDA